MNWSHAQINSLKDFQWQKRLVVIYTADDESVTLQKQLDEIKKEKDSFEERDLQVIVLQNQKVDVWNSVETHQLKFEQIQSVLGIDETKNYLNILIGKDGGVKLKRNSPISNQKLFDTIDAMPMRQREMRSRH
jgi:hypothetical protein